MATIKGRQIPGDMANIRVRCPSCAEEFLPTADGRYPPHNRWTIVPFRSPEGAGSVDKQAVPEPCPSGGSRIPIATGGVPHEAIDYKLGRLNFTGIPEHDKREPGTTVLVDYEFAVGCGGTHGRVRGEHVGFGTACVQLNHTPVRPGSIAVTIDGAVVARDDGYGAWVTLPVAQPLTDIIHGSGVRVTEPTQVARDDDDDALSGAWDDGSWGAAVYQRTYSRGDGLKDAARRLRDARAARAARDAVAAEPASAPQAARCDHVHTLPAPAAPTPDALAPGQTVWHKATGAGPWVTIRTAPLTTTAHVADGAVSREDGVRDDRLTVEDGWMVGIGDGSYLVVPEALLTHAEPHRGAARARITPVALVAAIAALIASLALGAFIASLVL